jgi:hypothetical protein
MRMIGLGVAIGIVLGLLAAQSVKSLLFGVSTADALTLLVSVESSSAPACSPRRFPPRAQPASRLPKPFGRTDFRRIKSGLAQEPFRALLPLSETSQEPPQCAASA